MTTETYIIDTIELFDRLVKYFDNTKSPFIVFDVETDTHIEKLAKLYGIGLCANDKKGFYLPWRRPGGSEIWSSDQQKSIINWFWGLANREGRHLVGHNVIFDVLVLYYNLGIDLSDYIYSDTILSTHLLNEEADLGLKDIAVVEFGEESILAQEELKQNVLSKGGKWIKDQKDMYLADTPILAKYCINDVFLTYKLFCLNEDRLKNENLSNFFYVDETMPLLKEVIIPMKRHGYPIDVPHFEKLLSEITQDIDILAEQVRKEIEPEVYSYIQKILDKAVPVRNTGDFPKDLADLCGIPIPINKKTGKFTLAAKALEAQSEAAPEYKDFYDWIKGLKEICPISKMKIKECQEKIWFRRNPDKSHIFNLNSRDDLGYYFFEVKKLKPLSYTDKEHEPQLDKDFYESLRSDDETIQKLLDYKKLQKIKSTYIEGILERVIDGKLHSDTLIFGTVTGRFSSRNPNCQNLPATKEDDSGLSPMVIKYTNAIREGFIAGKGNKIVNSDFSQLEVVCFARMSGDKKLQDTIKKGEDIYSRVAIDIMGITGVSADKKAPNYLKKVDPESRAKLKPAVLGLVYGMEEGRLCETLKCDWDEARRVRKIYFAKYPGLKKYMDKQKWEVLRTGKVTSLFGRVRHLPEAKRLYEKYGIDLLDRKWAKAKGLEKERRKLKALMNQAMNFPIQSVASQIINRSAIELARRLKKLNINARLQNQVHDELTAIAREDQAELVKDLMRDCMENTVNIDMPLSAEPLIADNWKEAK